MACKVNTVYAPNGEESILFKSLQTKLKSNESALNMWAASRTDAFVKMRGNWMDPTVTTNLKLDANGEPDISEVLRPEYQDDKEVMGDAEKIAGEYIDTVSEVLKQRLDMQDVLTRRINAGESSAKKDKTMAKYVAQLKKLRDVLKSDIWRESVGGFAIQAQRTMSNAKIKMEAEMKKTDPNIHIINNAKATLNAFDILDQVKAQLIANPNLNTKDELKYTNKAGQYVDLLAELNKAIDVKNAAKTNYTKYMTGKVNKALAGMSNRVDAEAMKDLLKHAPRDVSSSERWLRFAGDSRDSVIANVAKLVNQQQQKTRRESIVFSRQLGEKMDALEAAHPDLKGSPEKLYAPMMMTNSQGVKTGHIIHPQYTPAQYAEFKAKYEGTPVFEFHKFFVEHYDRLNTYLKPMDDMKNRIPTIMKGTFERIKSSESKGKEIAEHVRNSIARTNMDVEKGQITDDSGKPVDEIPTLFTATFDTAVYRKLHAQNLKKGMAEEDAAKQASKDAQELLPNSVSMDLGSSLQAFHHMATNHLNMTEIIDVVEGAKQMVYDRKVSRTDSRYKELMNKAKGMNDKRIVMEGSESNAYKMLESYIAVQVYGQREQDLGGITILGLEVDKAKLAKTISKYNSALMLGGNVLAGTANIAMGETMQWAEAFGGEYYKPKNYLKATAEYTKEMPGLFADVNSRFPVSKIGMMNELYDTLGDYYPGGIGADESSATKRAVKSGSLFFINSMGEHLMQSRAMMAFMMAKETYNKDGVKVGNLWESHSIENKLIKIKPETYVKNSEGKVVKYDKKMQDTMSRQMQTLLRRMHGNYNPETAAAWQRNAMFGLIGQFRKWITDGVARRYDKQRYNEFLEQDVEGTYRTTSKFMWNLITDLKQGKFQAIANWKNLTTHERANIVKTSYEIGMAIAMAGSLAVLRSLAKGLDEEEDRGQLAFIRFLMYLVNRLMMELSFYVNPLDTLAIIKSPAASVSTLEQSIKTMYYLIHPDDIYESGVNKGDNKLLHNFKRQIPLWKQYERTSPEGLRSTLEYFKLN